MKTANGPVIRAFIVEDEPESITYLLSLLKSYHDVQVVGTSRSLEEARVIIPSVHPDLLLLDIELSDGNSFELLAQLDYNRFQMLFVTAYDQFAIRAIKFGALDYILKPVVSEELGEAIDKVRRHRPMHDQTTAQLSVTGEQFRNDHPPDRIILRSQGYFQVVPFEQILYCHSDNGYTTFFFTDGRKVVVSKSLSYYEDLLPESVFLRTHQSFVVNQRYIDKYHKDGILVMRGGDEIPVSKRKRDEIIRFLLKP